MAEIVVEFKPDLIYIFSILLWYDRNERGKVEVSICRCKYAWERR